MQEWLTSMGIKYYESKMNLNWKPILKNISEVGRHLLPCCYCPLKPCPAHAMGSARASSLPGADKDMLPMLLR